VKKSVAWSAGVASTGRTDAVEPTRDGGIFQRINIIIWKFRCGAITNAAKRCGKWPGRRQSRHRKSKSQLDGFDDDV